jgi:hypothetical protein
LRVFDDRVVRGMCVPREGVGRGEVTGDCRNLESDELRDLFRASDVTKVVKSRRIRWAGM